MYVHAQRRRGPFLAGDQINFTCHVDPLPPEPVTYSWHAMTNANGSTLPGQKTTHYTPYHHFGTFISVGFSVRCYLTKALWVLGED